MEIDARFEKAVNCLTLQRIAKTWASLHQDGFRCSCEVRMEMAWTRTFYVVTADWMFAGKIALTSKEAWASADMAKQSFHRFLLSLKVIAILLQMQRFRDGDTKWTREPYSCEVWLQATSKLCPCMFSLGEKERNLHETSLIIKQTFQFQEEVCHVWSTVKARVMAGSQHNSTAARSTPAHPLMKVFRAVETRLGPTEWPKRTASSAGVLQNHGPLQFHCCFRWFLVSPYLEHPGTIRIFQ